MKSPLLPMTAGSARPSARSVTGKVAGESGKLHGACIHHHPAETGRLQPGGDGERRDNKVCSPVSAETGFPGSARITCPPGPTQQPAGFPGRLCHAVENFPTAELIQQRGDEIVHAFGNRAGEDQPIVRSEQRFNGGAGGGNVVAQHTDVPRRIARDLQRGGE